MDFKFIGWMNEDSHDKVWGIILFKKREDWRGPFDPTYDECVVFWGRRGKKLQMQRKTDDRDLARTLEKKIEKGYKQVEENKLYEVYPNFQEDLEMLTVMAALKH